MSPGLPTRLLATQSDERLIALARDGHERAFEAFVLRYRRPLLRYCRRLPLAQGRVEDVLQQSLLQAWMALKRGVQVREPRAWLYRIVHNTAVNTMRDSSVTPDVAGHLGGGADAHQGSDAPQLEVASEPDLEGGLVVREALAEMAALPPMQREVMVRTAMGGHSHEEVASALGITDGAVRGLLYRARATLRTAVTAVTPSPLLVCLAGGAVQSGQPSERLAELATGGGTAGLGGLLVKGGVVAVTAGTLITTSAGVLHIHASTRHGRQRASASAAQAAGRSSAGSGAGGGQATGAGHRAGGATGGGTDLSATPRATHRSGHAGGGTKAPSAIHHASHGGGSHRSPPRTQGGGPRAVPNGSPPTAPSPPPGTAPAAAMGPSGSPPSGQDPSQGQPQPTAQRQTPSGDGSGSSDSSGSSGSSDTSGGSTGSSGSGSGGDGHEEGGSSGSGCLSAGVGTLGVRVCLGDRTVGGGPNGASPSVSSSPSVSQKRRDTAIAAVPTSPLGEHRTANEAGEVQSLGGVQSRGQAPSDGPRGGARRGGRH